MPFVCDFLHHCFGNGKVNLSRLRAVDIVSFVQYCAPSLHLKRAKLMTTALRSFLRYARYRGDVTLDLAAAVPVVANWSMPSIPRAISAEQTRQLLASIDRRTAIGRRDYAILLLLARLGLRAGEVAFLELDDIDWRAGQVSVHGKSGQRSEMPYLRTSARQLPLICCAGVLIAPVVAYFYAQRRPSPAFVDHVASAPSSDTRFSALASTHPRWVPISSATAWPPRC